MRGLSVVVAGFLIIGSQTGHADAARRKHHPLALHHAVVMHRPVVMRSAAGTPIQPTETIIRHRDGSATVIVIPRRRSYLDTGTEVSVGDRSFRDYMLPPGGDPGRPNWFYGPDTSGTGGYPLRPFDIPGFNPDTPF
jgi:hypothetical protein